jgi:hypothetical protein
MIESTKVRHIDPTPDIGVYCKLIVELYETVTQNGTDKKIQGVTEKIDVSGVGQSPSSES